MNVGASSSSSSSSLLWRLGEFPSTNRGCKTTDIAEDIWFEIFVLLPLNLIFKFKCVSKVWLSLLSNPYFINKWIKHHNLNKSVPYNDSDDPPKFSKISSSIASLGVGENSKLISTHDGLSFKFLPPQLHQRNEQLYVVGSSNGLVLLGAPTSQNQIRYIVCNPLTQKWVSLPPPPPQAVVSAEIVAGFVCECLPSTIYKVVRIPKYRKNKRKLSIHIFSSDKNEWTICEVSCQEYVTWSCNGLVSHNGDLLWIENQNRILAYNLNKNKCRLIDLPAEEVGYSLIRQWLDVSEGLICCARVRDKESSFSLSVWVLMEENWQLFHKDIQLNDYYAKVKSWWFYLAFDPLDKNVVMVGIRNCVWAYNIGTRILEKLCEIRCNRICASDTIAQPRVLKLWPTILPAPVLLDI